MKSLTKTLASTRPRQTLRTLARTALAVALLAVPHLAVPHLAAAQDAEGDPAAGERVFAQCRACHQVGDNARNAIGPVLNDVFGREAGSLEDYTYSAAMEAYDVVWDHESFRTYIKDPRGEVPGTKMVYQGLRDEQRITDLIAFLDQYSDEDAGDGADAESGAATD